ncbi:MAG TPA: universal stress protein [Longimicrobium sp.]|jgi:nucleotide-binding universal stress UspA family protein
MRSILAVTDLTRNSDAALSAAAGLAVRTGAALHVVHSMEIVGMPLWEAVQTDVGRRIREAESTQAEQVRRAVPDGCALASRALDFQGLCDSVLLRAREAGADLVVFGAADPRTPEGARQVSALEGVAELADVPCLLVRTPLDPPPRRALLPLSAAEAGQGVLADACEWLAAAAGPAPAGSPATELLVLHVASGPREWRDLAADLDREVRWASEQPRWRARVRIRRGIRWSVAADVEILGVAAEQACDLVLLGPGCGVAGSPDSRKNSRALLLRRLPCPVLLLPGTLRPDEEGGEPAPEAAAREEPEPAMEVAAAAD